MSDDQKLEDWEKYLDIEEWKLEQLKTRKDRRRRTKKAVANSQKAELLAELSATLQLNADIDFTYTPARHEAGWILKAIKQFYEEELISDVVAQIKGGKEANVYLCRAHESVGTSYVAAKVYRPKIFRNLRNDAMYREGRTVRGLDGATLSPFDHRSHKAIAQKSAFGSQLKHESWMAHEFETMQLLHEEGAAVPEPLSISENAILMEYIGDENGAAPILNTVRLRKSHSSADIRTLFDRTIDTIETLLIHNLIHGDLSPYNILYWEGNIHVIDFPQVTAIDSPHAQTILERDIRRVCNYFNKQGLRVDASTIAHTFWQQYSIPYD